MFSAGSLIVLERGDKYFIAALDDGFKYITTAFDLAPAGAFKATGIPYIGEPEQCRHLSKLFDKLLKIREERMQLYFLKSRIQLEQIVLELLEAYVIRDEGKTAEDRLLPAIRYIERYYDRELKTEGLAALCNLSVSHFRRIFKKKPAVHPCNTVKM